MRTDDRQDEVTGAASGLAAVAVGAAATAFERGLPGSWSVADVAGFVTAHRESMLTQSLLFLVGAGFMLWFLGGVRTVQAAGPGSGHLPALVFGAGTAYVGLSVIAQAGQVAAALVAGEPATPELIRAMYVLSWALFTVAAVPAAVTLGAFAAATLRTRAFPALIGGLIAAAVGPGVCARLTGQVATDFATEATKRPPG